MKTNSDILKLASFTQPDYQKETALKSNHSTPKLDTPKPTQNVQNTFANKKIEQPTPQIRTRRDCVIKLRHDPDMI